MSETLPREQRARLEDAAARQGYKLLSFAEGPCETIGMVLAPNREDRTPAEALAEVLRVAALLPDPYEIPGEEPNEEWIVAEDLDGHLAYDCPVQGGQLVDAVTHIFSGVTWWDLSTAMEEVMDARKMGRTLSDASVQTLTRAGFDFDYLHAPPEGCCPRCGDTVVDHHPLEQDCYLRACHHCGAQAVVGPEPAVFQVQKKFLDLFDAPSELYPDAYKEPDDVETPAAQVGAAH